MLDVLGQCCEAEGDADSRIRVGIAAVLEFLIAEPTLACLLDAQAAAGVPGIAEARERLFDRLAGMLRSARNPASGVDRVSGTERRLVGGAFALVSESMRSGNLERLRDRVPELSQLMADFYGGPRARSQYP
jgi:hypothetical protein